MFREKKTEDKYAQMLISFNVVEGIQLHRQGIMFTPVGLSVTEKGLFTYACLSSTVGLT